MRLRDFGPSFDMRLLLKMFEGLLIFVNWNSFYLHIVITCVISSVKILLLDDKCVYIRKANKSSRN